MAWLAKPGRWNWTNDVGYQIFRCRAGNFAKQMGLEPEGLISLKAPARFTD